MNRPIKNIVKIPFIGFLLFLSLSLSLSLSGCLKKGDEDPDISLRTRMSRLTGKWKLVEYTAAFTSTCYSKGGPPYSISYSFDGSTMTRSFDGCCCMCTPFSWDTSYVDSYPYALVLTINENGSYSQDEDVSGVISSTSGTWKWGNSDKTTINLISSGQNYFYNHTIVRLSNKEMKFHTNGADSVYEKL